MPATAPYSAVKAALERWGESMAGEVAPFGIGVSVLVTGTYDTDSITDAGTTDTRVLDGPYARHHRTMDKRGRAAMRYAARPPEVFAKGLAKAVNATKPFERRPVGPDARMLMVANRLLPGRGSSPHGAIDDGYSPFWRDARRRSHQVTGNSSMP